MSDSEHSTVTYTSVPEDDSDIGSPGVEGPIFQDPPSPDYSAGPEGSPLTQGLRAWPKEPEQHHIHLILTIKFVPGAVLLGVLYQTDPFVIALRLGCPSKAPAPFLSEEVAERVLALPTPPPSPLSLYSSPLPQIPSPPLPIPPPISPTYVERSLGSRATGIRQRDTLPSLIHETEMPEMCLPLRKRPCRTTPGPGCEVGESSTAGAARQFGPTTAEADLYGFTDMLEAAPGPRCLENDARYDRALLRARVNRLDSDRPFHRRTALLIEEEARLSRAAWAWSMDACDQQDQRRQDSDFQELLKANLSVAEAVSRDPKIVKSLKASNDRATDPAGPAKILQSQSYQGGRYAVLRRCHGL
ncbi:hypothetical protein Tco_0004570 [Tanacetum coccineum]